MAERSSASVLIGTKDLFFRAKLEAIVRAAGATLERGGPVSLAVLALDATSPDQVKMFRKQGVAVLVFGPHVDAADLRAARAAGAEAVPNIQVEEALRARLHYLVSDHQPNSQG